MFRLEFDDDRKNGGNRGKYKMKTICNSVAYAKELEKGKLLGHYYLVTWNDYLEEEITKEPTSAI